MGVPTLTGEDLVARAEALAATLVADQAATEVRGHYSEEIHREFAEAGFYRILVPARFGGLELGVGTFLQVASALARGCPSTGWMYALGAAHAVVVGTFLSEQAQAELFALGDFISPAIINPSGKATRTADGWTIDGTWSYCSGAPFATHFIGHALVESPAEGDPELIMFVVPRERWTLIDDWRGHLGLRGSGSHSVQLEQVYVPGHHVMAGHLSEADVAAGTPGQLLHSAPDYGGGPLSLMLLESAFLAVGMARGALDVYEKLLTTRRTMFHGVLRSEDQDYQLWYGRAAGMIETAEAAATEAVRRWNSGAARPGGFDREDDLRLTAVCREVIGLSWRAVEQVLFPTAGSSAARSGERLERIWRDMSSLHSHVGIGVLLSTAATRELARVRFGVAS